MASKQTETLLRIAGGLVIIALGVMSLFLYWFPSTGGRDTRLGILPIFVAFGQFVLGILVMVGRTKAGRLVLTRRRWKYFTLIGFVLVAIILIMVTQTSLDRPEGYVFLAVFPVMISGLVVQLYEPESTAQFKLSDLSDRDARTWKRMFLVLILIGVVVGAIAGIGAAVGNIYALPLLLPIAIVSLVFAAGIWIMLRMRNQQPKAKP
jgi:hypothetical protein